jgi:signal transduction histidine kinase
MDITNYLDLVILGITIGAIGLLGFVVFFSNPKNSVNKAFLSFSLVSILWGSLNFFSYQAVTESQSLWLWRLVIFTAVWFCYCIFYISSIFPIKKEPTKVWYKFILIPAISAVSFLTLTPLVFNRLSAPPKAGIVPEIITGSFIPVFGITVGALVIGAVFNFIYKLLKEKKEARGQYWLIMWGTLVTFSLLILFNFFLPTYYKIYTFIPYGAVFIFPFIAAVGYAIIKYRLFNMRIIATEFFAFILVTVSVLQIFFSTSTFEIIFRMSIFVLIFVFAILLVGGTVNELKQREEIQMLADNLKSANDRLKELDRLKSEFLSIASHDLRTPITAIRNFMSLILDGSYGKMPAAAEEGLRQVFNRATDMTKLVDNYLNVSRIEQGRMKYDFVDADFTKMVQDAVSFYKDGATKKGLQLTLTVKPGAQHLVAKLDTSKINEVINNLLDNSIKYTPTGSIALSVSKEGNKAQLILKDTGVGMTQKTKDGLFKLFSPGEDSKRINPQSTGVGLYITKTHVEAHKGTLTAESEGQGKGSKFTLELPLA